MYTSSEQPDAIIMTHELFDIYAFSLKWSKMLLLLNVVCGSWLHAPKRLVHTPLPQRESMSGNCSTALGPQSLSMGLAEIMVEVLSGWMAGIAMFVWTLTTSCHLPQ